MKIKLIVAALAVLAAFWQTSFAGRVLPTGNNNTPMYGDVNTNHVGEEMLCRNAANGALLPIAFNTDGTRVSFTNSWLATIAGTNYSTNATSWAIDAFGDINGNGQDEIILRNGTTTRVLFFTDNGSVSVKGSASQPASFDLQTKWVIEGTGQFNTNSASVYQMANVGSTNTAGMQMFCRNAANGAFIVVYFNTNGTRVPWNATNTALTVIPGTNYSTNASSWTVQAIGDINGSGQDEVILRDTSSNASVRVLFFTDNGSSLGRLRSSQPATFPLQSKWIIQGMGHFNTNAAAVYQTAGSTCTNTAGMQMLCRNSANGALLILYFADNGTKLLSTTNNIPTTPIPGSNIVSTAANQWVVQAIGDVNSDGQDEVILRDTTATTGTVSAVKVLFFGDNSTTWGRLKGIQPTNFNLQTKWIIQGFKHGKKN